MVSRLFVLKKIKEKANKAETVKLTPTQTAKQALAAIEKKYGDGVKTSDKFYHIGNGEWVKYSFGGDRARQPKHGILPDTPANRENMGKYGHMYDMKGYDTKGAKMTFAEFSAKSKTVPQRDGTTKVRWKGGSGISDLKGTAAKKDVYQRLLNKGA